MDPVNGLNDIVKLLRQRMAQKSERTTTGSPSGSKSGVNNPSGPSSLENIDIAELQRRINDRISALDPDQRSAKHMTRIFLETVMIWEFGQEIVTDPKFDELVTKVQETMLNDSVLAKKLDQVLQKA